MDNLRPVYIWDKNLQRQNNKIAVLKNRATMVHSLISSYGLLSQMEVLPAVPTSHKILCKVHSEEYINTLRLANSIELPDQLIDKFNLGYDCPLLYRMYNFIRIIAGSSLEAAKALCSHQTKRAINWHGGWHHAQKTEAQGFCYVNDIAIAIFKLLEDFPRILYVDLDVHHGNGVENLFLNDPRVMTLSLHLLEPGFFPCTGLLDDIGSDEGQFYTVNVPLKAGFSDKSLISIFDRVSSLIHERFNPSAVVVQCGADCLNKDPLGHFSITLEGVGHCVKQVLSWNLPTLFLGGGGYNPANAARLWTYLTSLILGISIPNEIPEHKHFEKYGGGYLYELHISPGQREDLNTTDYLNSLYDKIKENLQNVNHGSPVSQLAPALSSAPKG